ncbi:MAG: type II toxin-antitoxin system RelE/ParE family toxin [Magnetococcales bacterium]|nr:type II toxin-antitoxin system RelE/ParE family toxin [Magnetococcales bacterium]
MTWTLLWDPVAARQVHKLDPMTQKRIIRKAVDLGLDPHPPGSRKLTGTPNLWRIREGDYRIIYAIEDDRLVVLIVKVGHRREVYR